MSFNHDERYIVFRFCVQNLHNNCFPRIKECNKHVVLTTSKNTWQEGHSNRACFVSGYEKRMFTEIVVIIQIISQITWDSCQMIFYTLSVCET